MPRIIAALLLACLGLAPASAAAFDQSDARRCMTRGLDWYAVTFKGARIGCMNRSLGLEPTPDGHAYVLRESIRLRGLSDGVGFDQTYDQATAFQAEPPFRLQHGRLRMGDGAEIRLSRHGDGYVIFYEYGGKTRRINPPPSLNYTLAHHCGLTLWLQTHPPAGASFNGTEFDLQQMKPIPTRATVTEVLPPKGQSQGERRKFVGQVPGRARSEVVVDENARMLSLRTQGMTFRLASREAALAETPPVDLLEQNTVQLDRPLRNTTQIVFWELEGPPGLADEVMDGPRQRMLCDARSCLIRMGEPNPEAARVQPEEREIWLQPMGGCPLDDPQLVRLTRQAVDGAESDRAKVRNIARFVKDYIRAVPGGVSMDVKDIMNTRQGDCGEHAMLFKAMCRAAGVPARVVLGYHPSGNPAEALMGHGWAEAAVDGAWLEADPIQNGIVRSPLRLRTAVMQSDDFADLFPLGGMQLKVRTVRRRAGSRPSP